jgi:hypothetical protein
MFFEQEIYIPLEESAGAWLNGVFTVVHGDWSQRTHQRHDRQRDVQQQPYGLQSTQ